MKYIGADIIDGIGVDVILNLHDINIPSESVGTVLLLETIKHIEFPRKAIKEIYRIPKPNSLYIMSSVMYFPIHNYPNDYWRFKAAAFKSLLRKFNYSFVDFVGKTPFPHTIIGIGFKGQNNITSEFLRKIEIWKKQTYNEFPEKVHKIPKSNYINLLIPLIISNILNKTLRKRKVNDLSLT
ncbi:MAG: methyltransferase domain-containing protein [Promethearchaeota archaeon]